MLTVTPFISGARMLNKWNLVNKSSALKSKEKWESTVILHMGDVIMINYKSFEYPKAFTFRQIL